MIVRIVAAVPYTWKSYGAANWHHQRFYTIVPSSSHLSESFVSSLYRSVVVASKKMGMTPSPVSSSTAAPLTAASSLSGGTPINSVAVVSDGDASQSTSADAAAGQRAHTIIYVTERLCLFKGSQAVAWMSSRRKSQYLEIVFLRVSDGISTAWKHQHYNECNFTDTV